MRNPAFSGRQTALWTIALLCLIVLVPSCGTKQPKQDKYSFYETVVDSSKPIAWGKDRDIHVFCDTDTWKILENPIRQSLEREIPIVSKEKYFNLVKVEIKDIETLINYKNLLFIGDLENKGSVSEHLRKSMLPRQKQRVQNTGGDMFAATNRWVKDQLVIYLVGSNQENLQKISTRASDQVYNLFLDRLGERLAYQAYQTKLIPADFYADYPFTLKVPENYRLFSNDKANRFLSLLYRMRSEAREFPDKYISVYYEDMQTDSLTLGWILEKRKQLALKYYEGDEFDPEKLQVEHVKLGNYKAISITGAWTNKKFDIGGGFRSFAFVDAKLGKAFLVDNVVYFPAGDKLPELLELQKISATFKAR